MALGDLTRAAADETYDHNETAEEGPHDRKSSVAVGVAVEVPGLQPEVGHRMVTTLFWKVDSWQGHLVETLSWSHSKVFLSLIPSRVYQVTVHFVVVIVVHR